MKKFATMGILCLLFFMCGSYKPIHKETGPLNIKSTNAATSFDFFRTHRQGKGITSVWALNTEVGVEGFLIKKTYEDPYDPYSYWVSASPAISCNSSRSYKWTDNNVSPGFVSYCVIALMSDGSIISSEASTTRIVGH